MVPGAQNRKQTAGYFPLRVLYLTDARHEIASLPERQTQKNRDD